MNKHLAKIGVLTLLVTSIAGCGKKNTSLSSLSSIISSPSYSSSSSSPVTLDQAIEYRLIEQGSAYEIYKFSPLYNGNPSITLPRTYLGKSVKSIGTEAFLDVQSITTIILPDTITSIGSRIFKGCSNLSSISLPASVSSISSSTFSDCSNLKEILVNSNNEHYKSIDGVLFSKDSKIIIKYPEGKENYHYNISISVTEICSHAFEGNTKLTSLSLPDSVSTIRSNAFANNSSLTIYTNATIKNSGWEDEWKPENLPVYWRNSWSIQDNSTPVSIFDLEINESTYELDLNPDDFFTFRENGNSFAVYRLSSAYDGRPYIKIPRTHLGRPVASIDSYAFSSSKLVTVIIPDSVTSIGEGAFSGCESLVNINIPNSVTSIEIGTFFACISLVNIVIPDSIKSIGKRAFDDCESLVNITIPDSVTFIGERAFSGCKSLVSINIPDSVVSIEYRTFIACISLVSIVIPTSVTSIGEEAFEYCYSLVSITIPTSVKSIGKKAFEDCTSLVSIIIPNSITSIESETFSGCTSLTNIVIPNSVTDIGGSAFMDCTSLVNIILPDSVTSIEFFTFRRCTSLVRIVIPSSVTRIDQRAFEDCPSLVSAIIPSSVAVDNAAFSYSANVTVYTDAESTSNGWSLYDNVLNRRIPVYFAGQWTLVDGVPTPN